MPLIKKHENPTTPQEGRMQFIGSHFCRLLWKKSSILTTEKWERKLVIIFSFRQRSTTRFCSSASLFVSFPVLGFTERTRLPNSRCTHLYSFDLFTGRFVFNVRLSAAAINWKPWTRLHRLLLCESSGRRVKRSQAETERLPGGSAPSLRMSSALHQFQRHNSRVSTCSNADG